MKRLVEEAERLSETATPGPWKLWVMSVVADPKQTSNIDDGIPVANTLYRDENDRPRTFDASFIAFSREAVPALCAEIRRLDEEREKERAAWIEYVQAQSRCTVDANAFERYRKAQAELSKYVDPSSLWVRSEQ